MRHLRQLMAHLGAADASVLGSLRSASTPPPDALELFAHVLAAEHVWHARLLGAPTSLPVWPKLDLDACERLAQENLARLEAFVRDLEERDLAREVEYTNSAGREFRTRIEDILLHVALHGSYHRGQIAWLVRQGGAVPASTDYIAFVRGAPAARRQPPP